MRLRHLMAASICAAFSAKALAGPTGLNAIPTCDILGHRELYVNFGLSGTERNVSTAVSKFGGFQFGAFDKVEFGYDNDFEGRGTTNIKVGLYSDKRISISAGCLNLFESDQNEYACAAFSIDEKSRLHAGWINDGSNRWMAGYDRALSDNWTLMIDTISGSDSYSYVGINWVMPGLPGFDITISGGIPHERANGYTYSVSLGYGTRF